MKPLRVRVDLNEPGGGRIPRSPMLRPDVGFLPNAPLMRAASHPSRQAKATGAPRTDGAGARAPPPAWPDRLLPGIAGAMSWRWSRRRSKSAVSTLSPLLHLAEPTLLWSPI